MALSRIALFGAGVLAMTIGLAATSIDTSSGVAVERRIDVSATAAGRSPGISSARADFRIAYTHSNGEGTGKRAARREEVFVMNADGSAQVNLSRHPGRDADPAWSPNGQKIAFLSSRDGKQEIYVVNADASGLRRLTRSREHEFAPAWSPDGRKLVFTRSSDRFQRTDVELYVMSADGGEERRLARTRGRQDGNPVWSGGAHWSPNGRMLAFTTKRNSSFDVYVMNANGSRQRDLSRNPARDFFYAWLPDGRIAIHSERGGAAELYVMNADGSGTRNLTREWRLDRYWPVWSPDGRRIAVVRRDGLYVANSDGTGWRKLVDRWFGRSPSWSPDGQKLAFAKSFGGWERGSSEIVVLNADGRGERRLTRRPGHDTNPVWSSVRVP
jgi:Tol biopolymer transport system component